MKEAGQSGKVLEIADVGSMVMGLEKAPRANGWDIGIGIASTSTCSAKGS